MVAPHEIFKTVRQPCQSQVRDTMPHMVLGVFSLTSLELGIKWQRGHPRLRRVAERADGLTGIREQQPRTVLVVADYLRHAVGPSCEEFG